MFSIFTLQEITVLGYGVTQRCLVFCGRYETREEAEAALTRIQDARWLRSTGRCSGPGSGGHVRPACLCAHAVLCARGRTPVKSPTTIRSVFSAVRLVEESAGRRPSSNCAARSVGRGGR